MKILYFCHSGVHASIVAAHLHLGKLPSNKPIGCGEIISLANFDHYPSHLKKGAPIFVGTDSHNNEVYTIPVGVEKFLVPKAIRSLMRIFNIPQEEVLLVNTLKFSTPPLKLGSFISNTLKLKYFGRLLMAYSLRLSYTNFVRQILRVKEEIKS